ncbi:MAG: D-tyrosyl-tRNA(Tyr) deacylase [Chloroflexi bacterium]|nr:MAG: D-tyrosyl-tRNA(Tyr) deacylase [Chloroflexota bacterium]
MRAVVQRVLRARVTVEDAVTGAIDAGLLVYLGIAPADGPAEVEWCARKIAEMRLFPGDAADRMDRSVENLGAAGAVLLVSQFTLYADTRRGRRPAFTDAAQPSIAAPLVEAVGNALRARGLRVEEGRFGAHMLVDSENDGPVTIILDSTDRERPRRE